MKTNKSFKYLILLSLLVIQQGGWAQKQSKTFKEEFKVGEDAVLDINTSHADITFETWDKNTIIIEATVELEGADAEEANKFYESSPVEIMGNSKRIEVKTRRGHGPAHLASLPDMNNFEFAFKLAGPEEALFHDLEIPDLPPMPEMPEMPPMPPIPAQSFDYERFEKEGEEYMRAWQKEFRKGFDKKYEKRLKEWAEAMKDRTEAWQERQEAAKERRENRHEERELRRMDMKKAQIAHREAMQAHKAAIRDAARVSRHVVISRSDKEGEPTVYFFTQDGEKREYKVKTSIRIKMPKSVALEMNVRYGEVKLAQVMKNIKAQLSYASLAGDAIEGEDTQVRVSYSPVHIKNWQQGTLQTDFSGEVVLNRVGIMDLQANSSEVVIERLIDSGKIIGNLGSIHIKEIAPGFSKILAEIKNGELILSLPGNVKAYQLNGTSSTFSLPKGWEKVESKGTSKDTYVNSRGSDPQLVIHASYSEVILD